MIEYAVNEWFRTIQGEAHWTGTPSTFIRLHGCPVGCPWCDTKYTWAVDVSDLLPAGHDVAEVNLEPRRWAPMDVDQIISAAGLDAPLKSPPHVVITGGEPCMHDLVPLTTALLGLHKTVQVETSGCFLPAVHRDTWLTVSPKHDMPGGYTVQESTLIRADEIKIPVARDRDIEQAVGLYLGMTAVKPVWLQPVSEKPANMERCVEAALEHGFRVSAQVHKYLNVQ